MSRFLDCLDEEDKLANHSLQFKPADNEMMITMAGTQRRTIRQKSIRCSLMVSDQKNGMEKHLRDLSAMGLLSIWRNGDGFEVFILSKT